MGSEGGAGLHAVQGGLAEASPAQHAVPTDRAEAGKLVRDRADNDVRLLGDSLGESLLADEDGPVDLRRGGTVVRRVGTRRLGVEQRARRG